VISYISIQVTIPMSDKSCKRECFEDTIIFKTLLCPSQEEAHHAAKKRKIQLNIVPFKTLVCPSQEEAHRAAKRRIYISYK